jgi:hypothetical protein
MQWLRGVRAPELTACDEGRLVHGDGCTMSSGTGPVAASIRRTGRSLRRSVVRRNPAEADSEIEADTDAHPDDSTALGRRKRLFGGDPPRDTDARGTRTAGMFAPGSGAPAGPDPDQIQ